MYRQMIIFVLIVIANIQCATIQDSTLSGTRNFWPNITVLDKLPQPIVKFTQFNTTTFLITKDDRVYVCGGTFDLNYPLLGLGKDVINVAQPTEIVELSGKKIVKICAGYEHLLAMSENGEIRSWGNNDYGQLGIGSNVNYFRPVLVNITSFVTDIQCGYIASYVLNEKQELFAWGYNGDGELGNGDKITQLKPVKVDLDNVVSVAPSSFADMVIGLTSSGQVYRWGDPAIFMPVWLSLDEKVVRIAASSSYCFILTETGIVYYSHRNTSITYCRIDTPLRFKSIYADRKAVSDHSQNTLVGETLDGEIYASRIITNEFLFKKINVESIADAFALLDIELWLSFMVRFENETSQTTPTLSTIVTSTTSSLDDQTSQTTLTLPTIETSTMSSLDDQTSQTTLTLSTIETSTMSSLDDQTSQTTLTLTTIVTSTTSSSTDSTNEHDHDVLEKMFDNPHFSDFEFLISNQTIFVDRRILDATSTWMSKQFSSEWLGLSSVSIDNYSYRTYYLYLYYLYTDRLDITLDEALDVYTLASNQHEDKLKEQCSKIIHSQS